MAYEPPRPGDPAALADWRWLARPLAGTRRFSNDPWGRRKLPPVEDEFLLLEAEGPGVLDHLWAPMRGGARLTIEVDGKRLWQGPFGAKGEAPGLFPEPLLFDGGGMQHLLAPIGFQSRLRLVVDKPAFPHFASYRTFPPGTAVLAASANGPYAAKLKSASDLWRRKRLLESFSEGLSADFEVHARSRATAFLRDGSGEVVALEFHMNPALTGTLREVVAEFHYDGAPAPSLRLPLTDLAGVPHPWPCGRWDGYNGDLAAGLRYPWYVNTPRYCFPEATVHLNLPIPFAKGLRIDLVNRSPRTAFVGHIRAVVEPLSADEASRAGRLCGTRLIAPLRPAAEPQPLLRLPGPGQVAGLSLFVTGNAKWPPAIYESATALTLDGGEPLLGHGLLPLWFQGIYGGPVTNAPIWNPPRFEEGFGGVTRHFLTDPIAFEREAVFGFTPGPKPDGAPTEATAVALWYRFGPSPYEAPALPDRAEPLPYSVFPDAPMRLGPGDEPARLAWSSEAEDLAPLATARATELRAIEDAEHDYHPSGGRFLQLVADGPGSYADFPVPLPDSRYVVVGYSPLWGPGRGTFGIDLLARDEAKAPPRLAQGDAFSLGRMLGSVPVESPVFSGESLRHRRDPEPHHARPTLNPAPGGRGVVRLTCQGKPMDASSFLLKLDRFRLDAPPPTPHGWRECEEMSEAGAWVAQASDPPPAPSLGGRGVSGASRSPSPDMGGSSGRAGERSCWPRLLAARRSSRRSRSSDPRIRRRCGSRAASAPTAEAGRRVWARASGRLSPPARMPTRWLSGRSPRPASPCPAPSRWRSPAPPPASPRPDWLSTAGLSSNSRSDTPAA